MHKAKISGMGHYLPKKVITNDDLSKLMDTSDQWIQERTGIVERRWVDPENQISSSKMGFYAAEMAINNSGINKSEIDHILFATISPDYYFPGNGVLIQDMLEIENIGATDIRNACSGFIYALSVANAYIQTGQYKNILVIGSELQSPVLDKSTRGRDLSVIFGDGAGAAIISRSYDESEIYSTQLHSEGKNSLELSMQGPSAIHWLDEVQSNGEKSSLFSPQMNGKFIFKNAIVRFEEVIKEVLEKNSMKLDEIDCLIPHQANLRISQFIQKKLKLKDDQVFNNIQKYGNTTGASIPIAMSEAIQNNFIKTGDIVCLAAFGAGFTWGATLLKY